jgi:hypothetical protein
MKQEALNSDEFVNGGWEVTPRGQFGPDFYNPSKFKWYDLTTSKEWEGGGHQWKYNGGFGEGCGALWQ